MKVHGTRKGQSLDAVFRLRHGGHGDLHEGSLGLFRVFRVFLSFFASLLGLGFRIFALRV